MSYLSATDLFTMGGDEDAPVVSAESPAPGATGVSPFVGISFEVDDDLSGADPDTLTVVVGGVPAITLGVPQTGFDGPLTTISPAIVDLHLDVTIAHQVLVGGTWVAQGYDLGQDVLVEWSISDADGNAASGSWTFTVGAAVLEPAAPGTLGFLEGYTSTVGDMLTAIGGVRATRLTALASAGDVVLEVETTLGWPDAGKIGLGGVSYRYTSKTATQLLGLYYLVNGVAVPGVQNDQNPGTAVLELSRSLGALDQLRRSFLTEYAEGTDLDAVGRNLGVERVLGVDDDTYRLLIQNLAYAARTTVQSIRQVLTALVGAGNYEIIEDLVADPCLVTIQLPSALLSSPVSIGKTFLQCGVSVLATSDMTADMPEGILTVGGIRWADEAVDTDCRTAKPSADRVLEYDDQAPPGTQVWEFQGADESTEVTVLTDDDGCIEISSNGPAYYRHVARALPESSGEVSALLSVPAAGVLDGTNRLQVALALYDGERALAVGVEHIDASTYYLGFVDVGTQAFVGTPTTLDRDTYYDVQILKRGRGAVTLMVDSTAVDLVDHADFAASTDHAVECGVLASGLGDDPTPRFRYLRVGLTCSLDYWALRGAAGTVATADPDEFDTGTPGSFLVGVDEDKALDLSGATAPNAQGGYANGRFYVAEVLDSQTARLVGPSGIEGATVETAHPQRVTLNKEALHFPDDLGKVLRLTGSSLGNNIDGVITALLHPITLEDLGSFATPHPETTDVCEIAAATFVSEPDLDWQLLPAFVDDSGISWVLSGAGELAAGVATWRDPLPDLDGAYPKVVAVRASSVYSAQLLPDEVVKNIQSAGVWPYYPAYLASSWHYLVYYLDRLVAAGVEVVVEFM